MSEYQCYEFVALDRPLTSKEMAELRAISTRAEITPTRFWNEYQWGDLKADPSKLLARYFDAHFYFANWGTRRFMLRLPAGHVNVSGLKPYFRGPGARLTRSDGFVVLDFWSDDDSGDVEDLFEGGRLAALTPVRALLLQGDLRAAYLAWLGSAQSGEMGETAREPPVPPGLVELTAPLASLVDVLRIDRDLLSAAAEASSGPSVDSDRLREWVKTRSPAQKDRWLLRAVDHPEAALGTELLAAFRKEHSGGASGTRRTVAELHARADQLRRERKAGEAVKGARAQASAAAARTKHLGRLAHRWQSAWSDLDKLIDGRAYDKAVALAVDLRELAQREGKSSEFASRFEVIRKTHARRRGFFDAFKQRVP